MTQKQPAPKYITAVYEKNGLGNILRAVSSAFVLLCVFGFIFVFTCLTLADVKRGICYALFLFLPFIAVSVLRKLVNMPRPYDIYDMPPSFSYKGRRMGRSFPSRHVFSAFAIGSLSLVYSVPIGIAVLLMGCVIGVSRVLLGIHFIRDVLAGLLIGVFSGTLGILILNFCL